MSWTIVWILLLQILRINCDFNSNLIQVYPLKINTGLYYDQIGKIEFFESTWKLITNIDITELESKIDLIDVTYSDTKILCNDKTFSNFSVCNTTLNIISKLIPVLKSKDESLKDLIGHTPNKKDSSYNYYTVDDHHRTKRGWFDGFGYLFKTVFGTLDAEDGEHFEKAFDRINKDKNEFVKILKQQTQVVQSTIMNFNSSITNYERNLNTFNINLRRLENFTKTTVDTVTSLQRQQCMEEHLELLNLIISEVDKEYTIIINAILFAKTETLHPSIISPSKLISELQKVITYLPTNTKFPIDLTRNEIYKLESVLKLNVFLYNNRLIFVISVFNETFDAYKLISLPIHKNDDLYSFILPDENSQYLSVSENRMYYVTLKDLSQCKLLSDDLRICYNKVPIYIQLTLDLVVKLKFC